MMEISVTQDKYILEGIILILFKITYLIQFSG